MSDFDDDDVIDVNDKSSCENEVQARVISLASENSPEETIRRMRAFPERAAKLRELIRALREESLGWSFQRLCRSMCGKALPFRKTYL
jgi:predicted RNA-binding protein with RPS1 domain